MTAPPTAQEALEALNRHAHKSGYESTELDTIRAFIESAAEGQREWVKCSDRMPAQQIEVFFVWDVMTCRGHWGGGSVWWDEGGGFDAVDAQDVTHWMPASPLPSPPEKGSI